MKKDKNILYNSCGYYIEISYLIYLYLHEIKCISPLIYKEYLYAVHVLYNKIFINNNSFNKNPLKYIILSNSRYATINYKKYIFINNIPSKHTIFNIFNSFIIFEQDTTVYNFWLDIGMRASTLVRNKILKSPNKYTIE